MIIIGDKELENRNISVRNRNGSDLGSMSIEEFSELINKESN